MPGVHVGRRAVLQLPALAALLLALPRVAAARGDDEGDAFEAFTEAWMQLADELLSAEAPNEDAYLHRLCGLLAGLPLSAALELHSSLTNEPKGTAHPRPSLPLEPSAPSLPAAPDAPVGPCGPVAPTGPVDPAGP